MIKRLLIFVAAGWIILPAASFAFTPTSIPRPVSRVQELTFGSSTQGRPIIGTRIGNGPRKLFVIANTHGGPEANTYQLALALQSHFRTHPEEVPEAVSLYIIPSINPDGLANGTRFNSRNVDLNRNMDTNFDACPDNDWNQTVQGAYGYVSDTGGAYVESELEAQLVRDLVLDASAVVWVHSSGGDVFPAYCEHGPSIALAQAYAEASGYRYDRYWGQYMITGGMHDWAGALGIASITPELATGELPEVAENLRAVQAILRDHERLLPLPAPTVEPTTNIEMPALLWRYWRAHGGPEVFGAPISPAVEIDGQQMIFFENETLIVNPEGIDVGQPVKRQPESRTEWTRYLLTNPAASYQLR